MLAYSLHEFHLFFRAQSCDSRFNDTTQRHFVNGDEAVIVHIRKEAHNELAIHSIRNSTMTWNGVAEVLNLEGTLETRCEETTKRGDEGRKGSKNKDVDLHWSHRERLGEWEPNWKVVGTRKEHRVWSALEASPDVRAQILILVSTGMSRLLESSYVDRTDEVLVSHQDIGHANSKDDSKNPSAHKSFHRLLW